MNTPTRPEKNGPGLWWSARKISDGAVAAGKTADRVHCGAAGRFPWLCQTKDDETTSRQDLGRSSHGNAAAEPEAKAKLTAHSQRQEMSKGAAAVSRAGSIGGSEQQQPSGGGEGKRSHQRGTCAVCTCTGPPHAPRPASCLLLLSRCSSRPAMGVASNAATLKHWGGGVGNRERPALARAAPTRCSDVGGGIVWPTSRANLHAPCWSHAPFCAHPAARKPPLRYSKALWCRRACCV